MEQIVKLFHSENLLINDIMVNASVEKIFQTDLDVIHHDFVRRQICKKRKETNVG